MLSLKQHYGLGWRVLGSGMKFQIGDLGSFQLSAAWETGDKLIGLGCFGLSPKPLGFGVLGF